MNEYRPGSFGAFRTAMAKWIKTELMPQSRLFEVDIDRDELWQAYLSAFPDGTNPMFRKRTVHDCSVCRQFIKKMGAVVAIIEGSIVTVWDFECTDPVYSVVADKMGELVRSKPMRRVFLTDENKVGCVRNFEITDLGDQLEWDHFHCDISSRHVVPRHDLGTERGRFTDSQFVFRQSLEMISVQALEDTLDLIRNNLLYRGAEWEKTLDAFLTFKKEYDMLGDDRAREVFAWTYSAEYAGSPITHLKNRSIGTLLLDLSSGMDIEEAVRKYEAITDPNVYKHPKPIFTEKMKAAAKEKLVELGFGDSLKRRFARLSDITINDILWADRSTKQILTGIDEVFADLKTKPSKADDPRERENVPEVTAEKFVSDILPTATKIEAFVDNSHIKNFVSLVAPENPKAKSMFSWGNGLSWAYNGNTTDSFKQKVAEFGGKIDGFMRFSIKWNEDGTDTVDLDAHCAFYRKPGSAACEEIYFGHKYGILTRGVLDVDIVRPNTQIEGPDKTAVENITWASASDISAGQYIFFVHQYSGSAKRGFRAELEIDGQVWSFDCDRIIKTGTRVEVAKVVVHPGGKIDVMLSKALLTSGSRKVWGIDTMHYIPVSAVCYSPNHWSTAEKQRGHKHLFLILDGCTNPDRPSGIFNEFLVHELDENRRVMAALSDQLRVPESSEQLSGLGFAMDKRDELFVRYESADGSKLIKITF